MRKGYKAELLCKKELVKKFGKWNVIKVAIGNPSHGDFLVLKGKGVVKVVEVKSTKKGKWRPNKREKEQFEFLKKFSKETGIYVEYWIKTGRKGFKVLGLREFEQVFK